MAQILEAYEAIAEKQLAESLAGQTATVIHRDGTRKEIRFGKDVLLRREGGRHHGTIPVARPIVEGHLESSQGGLDPEDRELVLNDGSVFTISFSHKSFFFAIEPLGMRRAG